MDFYVAEANVDEAAYYLPEELAKKHHLNDNVWRPIWDNVLSIVHVIGSDLLNGLENKAKARIAARDINDWPAVAATLLLGCPVWTEDQDFLGSGVATWTTATIEIYLEGH